MWLTTYFGSFLFCKCLAYAPESGCFILLQQSATNLPTHQANQFYTHTEKWQIPEGEDNLLTCQHVPYPEYEGSICLQTAVNTAILFCGPKILMAVSITYNSCFLQYLHKVQLCYNKIVYHKRESVLPQFTMECNIT
jgi:hypothetical protein